MLQAPARKEAALLTQQSVLCGNHARFHQACKAGFDYLFVVPALFFLLPLLIIISLLIKLESPGPVLHKQRVLGSRGRFFEAYNFRTTYIDASERLRSNRDKWVAILNHEPQASDPRVTRVGYYLRRLGLEDLPRLFNILNRQMSLVGPHLLNQHDVMRMGMRQVEAITTVKPGMTGLWQVRAYSTTTTERHALELEYINNWSLRTDLRILVESFRVIWEGNIL